MLNLISIFKIIINFFKILRNSCFSFSVILWYAVSLTCVEMLLNVSSISNAFCKLYIRDTFVICTLLSF